MESRPKDYTTKFAFIPEEKDYMPHLHGRDYLATLEIAHQLRRIADILAYANKFDFDYFNEMKL